MRTDLFGEPEDTPPGEESAAGEVDPGAPLAERMRPRTLDEFVGQRHLLGPGKALSAVARGEATQSLILWGPPGIGKTTLARLVAAASGMRFVPYSAVLSGIKEIRTVMTEAERERRRSGRRTLLFVDEIHRFNKAQQDAFLPFVERGDVLLIGATTENPSFEVIGALLSRCRTFLLEPLSPDDVASLLRRALESERGLAGRVRASDEQLKRIAHATDGDARRALTVLESAASLSAPGAELDDATLAAALHRKILRHDKAGEEHFNLISALHKSVRNSDADAALYWLVRMLEAGDDGRYVARRLVRMAVEDVGLADPGALRAALDAAEAWDRLGAPEGRLALAQAAVLLARAEKSNRLYRAYDRARADVETTAAEPVPMHLRNAVTAAMRAAGYGSGYRYVHDDPAAKDEMGCLPPSLAGRRYLDPPGPRMPSGEEEKGYETPD